MLDLKSLFIRVAVLCLLPVACLFPEDEVRLSFSTQEILDAGLSFESTELDHHMDWIVVADYDDDGHPRFKRTEGGYRAIATESSGLREYVYLGVDGVETEGRSLFIRATILAGKKNDDETWEMDYIPLVIVVAHDDESGLEIRIEKERGPRP